MIVIPLPLSFTRQNSLLLTRHSTSSSSKTIEKLNSFPFQDPAPPLRKFLLLLSADIIRKGFSLRKDGRGARKERKRFIGRLTGWPTGWDLGG